MRRLLLACVLLPLICCAQIPKPPSGTYVNDYTDHLTPAEINTLNKEVHTLEQKTSIQVAILLINDLPGNMSIEDYARNIGNGWKVGKAQNGIVYVAVLHERKQRLEIAKNLEGEIPDITAFEIIDDLKPYLQQEDYYSALELLITNIGLRLGVVIEPGGAEQTIPDPPPSPKQIKFEKEKTTYSHYGDIALAVVVLVAIAFCVWAWKYKKRYMALYTVDGIYTGIGSVYYTGPDNSYADSSGGFGDDGGGGFDGGGASGDW